MHDEDNEEYDGDLFDFPEDDEDDLSQVIDYNLVKRHQRPKSFSPLANSPKENKPAPERLRRMERQVALRSNVNFGKPMLIFIA